MLEIAGGIILAVLFFAALPSIVYWFYDKWEAIKTTAAVIIVAIGSFVIYDLYSLKAENRAAVDAAIRTCLAQRWNYDAQMECERAARNRNPGVASTEIGRMVEDAAAENQEAALADNKRDRDFPALTNADVKAAIHRAVNERQKAVRECMEQHKSERDAQTECNN